MLLAQVIRAVPIAAQALLWRQPGPRVAPLAPRVPPNGKMLRPVVPLVGQVAIHPQGLLVAQRVQQEPMVLRPVLVVVRIVLQVQEMRVRGAPVLRRVPHVQPVLILQPGLLPVRLAQPVAIRPALGNPAVRIVQRVQEMRAREAPVLRRVPLVRRVLILRPGLLPVRIVQPVDIRPAPGRPAVRIVPRALIQPLVLLLVHKMVLVDVRVRAPRCIVGGVIQEQVGMGAVIQRALVRVTRLVPVQICHNRRMCVVNIMPQDGVQVANEIKGALCL